MTGGSRHSRDLPQGLEIPCVIELSNSVKPKEIAEVKQLLK